MVDNLTYEIRSLVSGLPAREFAETLALHGGLTASAAQVTTSLEIADFMLRLSRASPRKRVHCVGNAADSLAIACMRAGNVPILASPKVPWMALVYALLTDSECEFQRRDALDFPEGEISPPALGPTLALPPLGMKEPDSRVSRTSRFEVQTGEGLYIEKIDERIDQTAVILTSNRVLFTRGPEELIRRHLVENDRIRAVISFPAGLLSSTHVPFTLLVLGKPQSPRSIVFCKIDERQHVSSSAGKLRSQDRRFIAQSEVLQALDHPNEPWCRAVSQEEIRQHDYVLAVDRYLNSTHKTIALAAGNRPIEQLGSLVEIIKPQALRTAENDRGVTVFEVSPAELPEYEYLDSPLRDRLVDQRDVERHRQQVLRPFDVLLSVKGTIGKSAIVGRELPPIKIFSSQSSVILRLEPHASIANPVALVMLLRSPLFQKLLKSVITGTTIPNVTLSDLRSLPIVIPTVEEHQLLCKLFETQCELQGQIALMRLQQVTAASNAWKTLDLDAPERIA
jgi:type I restriction enzyme M protein